MVYISYPDVILAVGSVGADVKAVQSAMNIIFERYPICQKLEVDGVFDEKMKQSLRKLQRAVDIKIEHIIDKKTWESIFSIANFILLS